MGTFYFCDFFWCVHSDSLSFTGGAGSQEPDVREAWQEWLDPISYKVCWFKVRSKQITLLRFFLLFSWKELRGFLLVILKGSISFQQMLLKMKLVVKRQLMLGILPWKFDHFKVRSGKNNPYRWTFFPFLIGKQTGSWEFIFIAVMRTCEQQKIISLQNIMT